MQQEKNSNYPSNAFGGFWMKVPLVVRSILSGFGVSLFRCWHLGPHVITNIPVPWSIVAYGYDSHYLLDVFQW